MWLVLNRGGMFKQEREFRGNIGTLFILIIIESVRMTDVHNDEASAPIIYTFTFLTMAVVKEFRDVECTTGGPRHVFVEANKQRGHQVMSSKIPKQPLAGFGVIMGHAQNMT